MRENINNKTIYHAQCALVVIFHKLSNVYPETTEIRITKLPTGDFSIKVSCRYGLKENKFGENIKYAVVR